MVFEREPLECRLDHLRVRVGIDLDHLVERADRPGRIAVTAGNGKLIGEVSQTVSANDALLQLLFHVRRDREADAAVPAFQHLLLADRHTSESVEGYFSLGLVNAEHADRFAAWTSALDVSDMLNFLAATEEHLSAHHAQRSIIHLL